MCLDTLVFPALIKANIYKKFLHASAKEEEAKKKQPPSRPVLNRC